MSTSILTAPSYDPKRARRKKLIGLAVAAAILIAAGVYYVVRYWPEEHKVSNFFSALQAKDFEKAYGIWMADPNWQQHPQAHPRYGFHDFYLDWGPGGEYGLINSYHVDRASSPKSGSGVVVQVTVNDRTEKCYIWVEKSDKTLTFSPFELR